MNGMEIFVPTQLTTPVPPAPYHSWTQPFGVKTHIMNTRTNLQRFQDYLSLRRYEEKAGTLPIFSLQKGETCSSHSIGKALVKILHLHGLDSDQEQITEKLVQAVQPNGNPENPDAFHNTDLEVEVEDQETKEKSREKIRVIVEKDCNNKMPRMTRENLQKKKWQ